MVIRAPQNLREWDLVRELARDYQRELAFDLCFQGFEAEMTDIDSVYQGSSGAMRGVWDGDELLAIGGLRNRGLGIEEVKRLYVIPSARGRGLSKRLMAELETLAYTRGALVVRLDTLSRLTAANVLYEALGYAEVSPFNFNPDPTVRYFERAHPGAVVREMDGFLFDLDGTLINSLPAVDRAWAKWAARVGLPPEDVLPHIHGRRSFDSVKMLAPNRDPLVEDAWLRAQESADTEGVEILPGSRERLDSLPEGSWAIVTSGTSDVATARCRAVGITPPPASVFGEDVVHGKPHPEPFATGRQRLGTAPERTLGFEDTEAGLASGLGAGLHGLRIGEGQHPSVDSVRNLTQVVFTPTATGIRVTYLPN